MDGLGIGCGFGAALFQSVAYGASRWYLKRTPGNALTLLVTSHVWMGFFALLLVPVLGPVSLPPLRDYAWPAVGAMGFYLVAQAALFQAIRRTDASRIAPLLGVKVFVLALISALALRHPVSGLQWMAVAASAVAVLVLNESGGRPPGVALAGVAVAVLGYSLSDLSIKALVTVLAPTGPRAALVGACLTYLLGAAVCLPLLAGVRVSSPRLWMAAAPYAAAWFISMLMLYIAFERIGVVFGNIIQSTRGLMAILLGVAMARMGMVDLETHLPRALVVRRLAGAALMTAAIVLYLNA